MKQKEEGSNPSLKPKFVNPHQGILNRLIDRPFHKSQIMTSKSVKDFMSDIYQDGLRPNMLIFEPNFVKNYSNFSQEYLDLHVQFNTSDDTNDFLIEYEKIVQPRRWQRVYREVFPQYTKKTQSIVFQDKEHQKTLFSQRNSMPKPLQVLVCSKEQQDKYDRVMAEIKEKLKTNFLLKTESYNRGLLEAYKQRKKQRIQYESSLPKLDLEEKKAKIVEEIVKKRNNKREFSESLIKDVSKDVTNNMTYMHHDSTQISKNQIKDALSRDNSRLFNIQSQSTFTKSIDDNKSIMSRQPSIVQLQLNQQRSAQSFISIAEEDNSHFPKKEISIQLQVKSAILSLSNIINKFIKEKQKKNSNDKLINESIDLCAFFIKQIKETKDIDADQVNEIVERIENLMKQFNQQNEQPGILKQTTQIKASFIQQLELLNMQYNQLRNVDSKYKKYYEISQNKQRLMVKDYINEKKQFQISEIQIDNNDDTKLQELNSLKDSLEFGKHDSIEEETQSFDDEDDGISSSLPSIKTKEDTSPKSPMRRPTFARRGSKLSQLKKSGKNIKMDQSAKIMNILQRKKTKNKFDKLVAQKDMQKLADGVDIQKAVDKALQDLQPYKYYDEVIHDYFGGNIDFSIPRSEKKEKMKTRQEIVEGTIRDLVILLKEDAMTRLKALTSIENHVKNEKKLDFKQKQNKSVLQDFVQYWPDKIIQGKEDAYTEMNKFYDEQKPIDSLSKKFGSTMWTFRTENKADIGYDALLFCQDLKMFHNENQIPLLLEKFIEKNSISSDYPNDHRKNLIFYRRQLDLIEQKLIKLIQKFQ